MELRKKPVEETQYESQSKERLKVIITKKMRTIMIGAIASIEEEFQAWLKLNGKRTLEEQEFFNAFQACRASILDKGNDKIRDVEDELAQYVVEWKRYNYEITNRTEQ